MTTYSFGQQFPFPLIKGQTSRG